MKRRREWALLQPRLKTILLAPSLQEQYFMKNPIKDSNEPNFFVIEDVLSTS
jgi:hypothetical protein